MKKEEEKIEVEEPKCWEETPMVLRAYPC